MRYISNSLTLIFSFICIYLEEQFLSDYRTQIIGILIISYFAITFLRRKYAKDKTGETFSSSSDIFIVNTIVILLIIATGNIYSPVFFLAYFLCFGITFIFEPITVFIFAIGTVLIFLPYALQNLALEGFIKLGSMFLIAPLAFFFGKEYKDREKLARKVEETKEEARNISKDIETVIGNEKNMQPENAVKLSDALNRTRKLKK
ncbi:MAG TPA: hypothetical protein VLF89_07495 [Candidatus Saccharimonadales bacterium]|nr:hypothetical protein [Candidatus Saccharimonadales bacterium]